MFRNALSRTATVAGGTKLLAVEGIADVTPSCLNSMLDQRRWATKRQGGSTKNSKDSHPKYLGLKKFGSEWVIPGNIIIRQRGTEFHPGDWVGMGKDHTIFALVEGQVRFSYNKIKDRRSVHVDPGKMPPKKIRPWFRKQGKHFVLPKPPPSPSIAQTKET
ncbi:hypothetical protein BSKO_12981 [Bryopsis sp. KO-2023]|nr:hypothetical protein BSKO_12981 [Bryopsis sp. KO-2023]